MANRFWVGGTGSWDATTTHWSATSGGAGGATVPTAADDVFFDNLSNATLYTCTLTTLPVCRSLSISGPALGNVTIAGTVGLTISGSLSIASTGVTRTYSGAITFNATTTGWTVSAGVSLASAITFNGVGGGWTLTAGLTTTGATTVTAGAFNTAGFALTAVALSATGALTRSISLGASVVTVSSGINFSGSVFTFTAGTSTINISASSPLFPALSLVYYDVNFTATIVDTVTFTGSNTFHALSFTSISSSFLTNIVLGANQTISTTLTFPAPTTLGSSRFFVQSSVYGTTRTLTAATVALTDVDFQDITGAGAASWTGTRLGDAGGNSNITFSTPKTVYWNLVTGGVITGNGWALSSGGTPSAANFPLPQDTMTFVDTGLNTSATITLVTRYNIAGIDCSVRTLAMTLATVNNTMYGSIALSTSVTLSSGVTTLTFQNRGAITITSAGRTFPQMLSFNGIGGTYTLDGAWTVNGLGVTLTYGTLSLGTYTFTCSSFTSNGLLTRALAFGTSGSITTTGTGGVWGTGTTTNLTITGTNPLVTVSNNTATATSINSGATVGISNLLSFSMINGTYALDISGSSRVNSLNFTGYAGAVTYSTPHIYGGLTLSTGMTITSLLPTFEGASNQSITSNGKTLGLTTVNKTAGVVTLSDNYISSGTLTLTAGSLTANANVTCAAGITHTAGSLTANANVTATTYTSSNTNTRSLTMGSGTWTLTGIGTVWSLATTTGMTLNAGTSTIVLVATVISPNTFAGGGLTYNNLVIGGTGTLSLTFTGSNTFTGTISSTKTTAHTILFTAGTTTTVADWTVTGTVGNVVTIGSVTAASHNLVKTGGGNISVNYMSISRSNASP